MGKKENEVPEGQMDFFPLLVDPKKKAIMKNAMINGRWHFKSKYAFFLLRAAISEVKVGDTDFGTYFFTTGSIAEEFNVDKATVSRNLESWLDEVYDESLVVLDTERGFLKFHWATAAGYDRKKGFGVIKLSEELKPYLLEIKDGNFGGYDNGTMLELGSFYAARIYDILNVNCHGYEFKEETQIYISLDEIRFKCGLDYEDKQRSAGDIKQRIIDPSIARIAEVKNLEITCVPRTKKGTKTVLGYELTVVPRKDGPKGMTVVASEGKRGKGNSEAKKSVKMKPKKNSFNDFRQNEYDMEELERLLLSNEPQKAEGKENGEK